MSGGATREKEDCAWVSEGGCSGKLALKSGFLARWCCGLRGNGGREGGISEAEGAEECEEAPLARRGRLSRPWGE